MRINLRLAGLYLFILAVAYLASAYFGSYLRTIYIFFLLFPPVIVLLTLIGAAGLEFTQSFTAGRPVKGASIEYLITARNRFFLPVTNITGTFTSRRPGTAGNKHELFFSLRGKGRVERRFLYECTYCGTYELEYEKFFIKDLLSFSMFTRSMPDESIFVYPRVLPLSTFSSVVEDIRGTGSTQSPDGLTDTSLFLQLREYREGESIRHMSWKKYAGTGRLFLKDFDKTRKTGVRIYMDLRRDFTHGVDRLEQQDISLETLTALVKYFLDRGIEVQVSSAGHRAFRFYGDSPLQFNEFYDRIPDLKFSERISPLDRIRKDSAGDGLSGSAVIILSHMNDPELFGYPDKSGKTDIKVIANIGGRESTGDDMDFLRNLNSSYRGEFYVVEDSERIIEELETHVYAGG